uniref:Uncharacterized protein n=1 Tax=Oryza brachyantha TaxID=4533 RepID=J3N4U4_ORYBR
MKNFGNTGQEVWFNCYPENMQRFLDQERHNFVQIIHTSVDLSLFLFHKAITVIGIKIEALLLHNMGCRRNTRLCYIIHTSVSVTIEQRDYFIGVCALLSDGEGGRQSCNYRCV